MKKFWNFVKNEDTSETELLFNGPISEDTWWGDEVTPNVINLKQPLNGRQNVWKNRNYEGMSDLDGLEKDA